MDDPTLLMELETVARKLEVRIRYEDIHTPGGLCTVRGQRMIILPRSYTARDRAAVLARELSALDHQDLFMPPQVRDELWQPFDRLTGEWWAVSSRADGGYPSAEDLQRLQTALLDCERAIDRHQSARR